MECANMFSSTGAPASTRARRLTPTMLVTANTGMDILSCIVPRNKPCFIIYHYNHNSRNWWWDENNSFVSYRSSVRDSIVVDEQTKCPDRQRIESLLVKVTMTAFYQQNMVFHLMISIENIISVKRWDSFNIECFLSYWYFVKFQCKYAKGNH